MMPLENIIVTANRAAAPLVSPLSQFGGLGTYTMGMAPSYIDAYTQDQINAIFAQAELDRALQEEQSTALPSEQEEGGHYEYDTVQVGDDGYGGPIYETVRRFVPDPPPARTGNEIAQDLDRAAREAGLSPNTALRFDQSGNVYVLDPGALKTSIEDIRQDIVDAGGMQGPSVSAVLQALGQGALDLAKDVPGALLDVAAQGTPVGMLSKMTGIQPSDLLDRAVSSLTQTPSSIPEVVVTAPNTPVISGIDTGVYDYGYRMGDLYSPFPTYAAGAEEAIDEVAPVSEPDTLEEIIVAQKKNDEAKPSMAAPDLTVPQQPVTQVEPSGGGAVTDTKVMDDSIRDFFNRLTAREPLNISEGGGQPGGGAFKFARPGIFSAALPESTLGDISPRDVNLDWTKYGFGPEASFFMNVPQRNMAAGGRSSFAVRGKGSGRSDEIPARLSDGEYVIDAETVALLGDGSSKAGADRLDQFRINIRKHKGKNLARGKFSVNAKRPDAYMAGGRK